MVRPYDCDSGGPARLLVTSPRTWAQDVDLLRGQGRTPGPQEGARQLVCPTLGPGIVVLDAAPGASTGHNREVELAEGRR